MSCGCSIGTSIFYGLWYLRLWIGTRSLSTPVGLLCGYCGPPLQTWMWNYDVEFYFICMIDLKSMLLVRPEKEESIDDLPEVVDCFLLEFASSLTPAPPSVNFINFFLHPVFSGQIS